MAASISSVITGGFGVPGSASLVITDGYGIGAEAATLLRGRRRRRFRLSSIAQAEIPSRKVVEEEKALVDELLAAGDVADLISEQNVLRGAIEMAAARQRKTIEQYLRRIERRVEEIIEDDEVISLLIQ